MKNTNQQENPLIKGLEKYYPNVVNYLNVSGKADNIKSIEDEIKEKLPESFKNLYQLFDGEDSNQYVGVILGLRLLDTQSIINEIRFFRKNASDIVLNSMSGNAISEKEFGEKILVPFAFDNDECYIALDLTPGREGKKGQIITLDLGNCESYLLADCMESFYDFILKMMEERKCQVAIGDEGEEYFAFESGHFFNVLEEIFADN